MTDTANGQIRADDYKLSVSIMLNDREQLRTNALVSRLRQCKPGETYPLDFVERELILITIDFLKECALRESDRAEAAEKQFRAMPDRSEPPQSQEAP
jgi:hypothetical protein